MPIFTKESIESLRRRVDLLELLSSYVDFKKAGGAHRALCPFHDEKTPSFFVQKGDSHYHCFGCGAHGDAIGFLMTYLKMSFLEAVEHLAERFHVHLEVTEEEEREGPKKKDLRSSLDMACRFFHFYLLHASEGRDALAYLESRGIDRPFIERFKIGLAPRRGEIFLKTMEEKKIPPALLEGAGLVTHGSQGKAFFHDRIVFPIHDTSGAVIGFSARKYREETFGGKYVNTPETPLFKKSHLLFALYYSRRRIAKERQAIIVEGQIDALRLIQEGFDYTVAGLGTAFGAFHASQLIHLGVRQVFLSFDPDTAGKEAAIKVGDLFQKEGVEVKVVPLPPTLDPDSFLRKEGKEAFQTLLNTSPDYLSFLITERQKSFDSQTPAGKNSFVAELTRQIKNWNHPLMVHESLRKVASLLKVPESLVGVGYETLNSLYIKQSGSAVLETIDPQRILEADFLRWLLLVEVKESGLLEKARRYITPDDLRDPVCKKLYQTYLFRQDENLPCDTLSLVETEETQELLSYILEKKIDITKAESGFVETIQRLLDRNWLEKGEKIRLKIQSGHSSETEALELVRALRDLKAKRPLVE